VFHLFPPWSSLGQPDFDRHEKMLAIKSFRRLKRSIVGISGRQPEPTMVRLFNILDYWAQLAQRSVALQDGLGYRGIAIELAIGSGRERTRLPQPPLKRWTQRG
jgi:hypothetical protein